MQRLALPWRPVLCVHSLRRREQRDEREVPRQVPVRLCRLSGAEECRRGEDVHPDEDGGGDELWELIKKPKTHIYMCGLKGMESGMEQCFSEIAEKEVLVWKDYAKQMKKDKRYHVEVY